MKGPYKREIPDVCAEAGGTLFVDLAKEYSVSYYGKEDTECPITAYKLCGDAKCTRGVRYKHKDFLSISGSVITLKLDTPSKNIKFNGVAFSRGS